jgi:hypothetical protein
MGRVGKVHVSEVGLTPLSRFCQVAPPGEASASELATVNI